MSTNPNNHPTNMDENNFIEPLTETETEDDVSNAEMPVGAREITSDYDPSDTDTRFGSLTSSVNGHVWEYGRRYHAFRSGRYCIPNDEGEEIREKVQHDMMKELLDGRLFLAPIGDNPQKIIDLGTGFGQWTIEVGELFPGAHVTGIDLSPVQPRWVPPNVHFVIDDIEDDWVHDNDYDFAHIRFVNTVLKDNETLLRNVLQNLRPGGWIEIQDIVPRVLSDDGTVTPEHGVTKFYSLLDPILREHYGYNIFIVEQIPDMLRNLGFVNVQQRVYRVPLGEWARDRRLRIIGGFLREILLEFFNTMVSRPMVESGTPRPDVEEALRQATIDAHNKRIHAYMTIHFIFAQKPEI